MSTKKPDPVVVNPHPTTPLPPPLLSALLSAMYAAEDSIPRLQNALTTALDASGFSTALYELILQVLRDSHADAAGSVAVQVRGDGNLSLGEEEVFEKVMVAVRRARLPTAAQGADRGEGTLQLRPDAREEILKVVRAEVGRVAVVRDDGVDTPFGRMY